MSQQSSTLTRRVNCFKYTSSCTEYIQVKTELPPAPVLVANSPRFPLPPRVSERRAPSEAASPFAQPGGHKPQGWSLWSPLCPAADCRAKPYFQTGSWVQEPRPLHPVLWLTSQHVGNHRWKQSTAPHPSTASQEAEHSRQEQNGSPCYSGCKGFAFFLVCQEWNLPLSFCNSGGVLALLPLRSVLWDHSQGLHRESMNHSTALHCSRMHGASRDCINQKKPVFLGHFIYFPCSQGYASENETLSEQVELSL